MKGVSVVICCYNSSKRIPKVLEHLKLQEVPSPINWEVIIVDNASADDTAGVAKSCWGNHPIELRVVHEPKSGLSHARITGIKSSKYDYVTLVDDDNWVESRWVEKIFKILNTHNDVALCGGRGIGVFETEEPWWFKNFQGAYAVGPQHKTTGIMPGNKPFLYGAGIGMKKQILLKLFESGFNFRLTDRSGKKLTSGGDYELCLVISLLGYKLYYDDSLTFYHYMPAARLTWDYMVNLTRGFGRSSAVIQQYQVDVYNYRGFQRLKFRNYFLSVLMSFDRLIWSAIKLMPYAFSDKTGSEKYYKYVYNLHSFLAKLTFYSKHKHLVADLQNRKWSSISAAS